MSDQAFGAADGTSDASDYNAISFLIQQALAAVQTSTIAQVVAVHGGGVAETGTVDIKVLVNLMSGNRTAIPHGVVYGVPFLRTQGGSNAVICDPQPGDIGLVVFGSRDITSVKNARGQANPGSYRMFDWADAMYVGGVLNTAPVQYLQFLGGSIKGETPMFQMTGNLSVGSGYTGTFTTPTGNVVTVQNGIITNVD